MFRMSRASWLDRIMRPRIASKVTKTPKEKKEPKVREWLITLPDDSMFLRKAMTKSEARAVVKKKLKLDRLPPHTRVRCVS